MKSLEMFQIAQDRYLELIISDHQEKLSNKSAINGIYALLFPQNEINNIIPLYIGQSKNIKNRFMNHKTALNKLFKMTTEEFNYHINSGQQDGNHLYTKMVLYLKANNLTPQDLQIKVLISNLDKTYFRLKKEQELIEYYQTEIFGFNQLEFIQLANRHSNSNLTCTLTSVSKMWNSGINFINKFDNNLLNYGYYQFNLESFISWGLLEIDRVENPIMLDNFKYATRVINQSIFQEFKNKFNILISKLNIN